MGIIGFLGVGKSTLIRQYFNKNNIQHTLKGYA